MDKIICIRQNDDLTSRAFIRTTEDVSAGDEVGFIDGELLWIVTTVFDYTDQMKQLIGLFHYPVLNCPIQLIKRR